MIGGGAKRVWQTMHTSAPHSKDPPGKGALLSEHLGRNPSTSCRMGRSRRKVIWVLCSLLLLLEASSAKNIWKRALHARLAEKPHAEEVEPPVLSLTMPGPGAFETEISDFSGPALPLVQRLGRHSGPRGSYKALYKKDDMAPPPVVDWLVEPKPRWLGGNGWLLDGPEEVLQAETCSTTEDGAEPLLCPSGYECHILSPGDMAKGIPNRGQCVKQGPAEEPLRRHTVDKKYPEGDTKNVAEHGKGQQRHVH
ncbi:PREDICTED: WAP four-disulfide core domain protein 1 [Myotis davidii]|uniref:WAP four-disulfide core domain protein 1 n=1 Tax=Myotis davidii TaxID=225400 RepID=UPI000767759F|nr:PREDICTED: WAP four-disulfide core domain protein 1 [Myotis davidii]